MASFGWHSGPLDGAARASTESNKSPSAAWIPRAKRPRPGGRDFMDSGRRADRYRFDVIPDTVFV
jgi:hypothetical protein